MKEKSICRQQSHYLFQVFGMLISPSRLLCSVIATNAIHRPFMATASLMASQNSYKITSSTTLTAIRNRSFAPSSHTHAIQSLRTGEKSSRKRKSIRRHDVLGTSIWNATGFATCIMRATATSGTRGLQSATRRNMELLHEGCRDDNWKVNQLMFSDITL